MKILMKTVKTEPSAKGNIGAGPTMADAIMQRDAMDDAHCTCCTDCAGCTSCHACVGCISCSQCGVCRNCAGCSGCVGCQDCVCCHGCAGCTSCSVLTAVVGRVNKKTPDPLTEDSSTRYTTSTY